MFQNHTDPEAYQLRRGHETKSLKAWAETDGGLLWLDRMEKWSHTFPTVRHAIQRFFALPKWAEARKLALQQAQDMRRDRATLRTHAERERAREYGY